MAEDKVQVPSRRKDGTPDQTENYELVGDKETTTAAIAEQLAQQAVSEADQKRAAEAAAVTAEAESLSPEEEARKSEYDALVEQARSEAEAEVEARWVDPASRQTEPEETTTRSSRRRSAAAESTEG
jgi:hypothetical protein